MKTPVYIVAFISLLVGYLAAEDPTGDKPVKQVTPTKSPLIGTWSNANFLGTGNIPAYADIIVIEPDGTYYWTQFRSKVEKKEMDGDTQYTAKGAEISHDTGKIDLKTGHEAVTEEDKAGSLRAIIWKVEGRRLHYTYDLGNMGGTGVHFHRIDD